MAGSNQSQNLYGLLSGLTGAFNQEDMGQGLMFAQNIRDYNAPTLEPESPASLRAYGDYLQRNGNGAEAQKYLLAANALETEQKDQAGQVRLNQMLSTLSDIDEQRQTALDSLTVPGGGPVSPQQIAEVNANFDSARAELAARIDAESAKLRTGTGVDGSDALRTAKARDSAITLIKNQMPTMRESERAQAELLVDGLKTGVLEPKDIYGNMAKGGAFKADAGVQKSVIYKDGSVLRVNRDGSVSMTTPDGNELQAGDAGWGEATKTARDAGVAYAADVAGASTGAENDANLTKEQLSGAITQWTNSRDGFEATTFLLEDAETALASVKDGKISTGPVMGRLNQFFGGPEYGKIRAMSRDAAIAYLSKFKGTTTDFEYSKAEAAAFVDLLMNNEINEGTMSVVIERLKRVQEAQRRMAQEAYDGINANATDAQAERIFQFRPVPAVLFDRRATYAGETNQYENESELPSAAIISSAEDGESDDDGVTVTVITANSN